MEQLGSHWMDFHEIWYLNIFRKKTIEKIQVLLKFYENIGCFTWRPIYIFLSYLAQFFLEWEVFETNFVEKIKTHILCSVIFFRKLYRLWDNVEKYLESGKSQLTIWRRRISCCIPKATNTFSEYVIVIAFSLQQMLYERFSLLRYTYSILLVLFCFCIC